VGELGVKGYKLNGYGLAVEEPNVTFIVTTYKPAVANKEGGISAGESNWYEYRFLEEAVAQREHIKSADEGVAVAIVAGTRLSVGELDDMLAACPAELRLPLSMSHYRGSKSAGGLLEKALRAVA